MKLLISGSRNATETMKATVWRAVERAKELDWEIIVGDAWGIDAEVIAACILNNVPYHVYGITEKPRCRKDVPYTRVNVPDSWGKNAFLYRDRVMVETADKIFAIWNGKSHGTKWTYDYACTVGKEAWIT